MQPMEKFRAMVLTKICFFSFNALRADFFSAQCASHPKEGRQFVAVDADGEQRRLSRLSGKVVRTAGLEPALS